MCLVLVAYRQHPRHPLIVVANRDEFRARPTDPLHRWPDGLWAGRDRQAGGTWMAVRADGAFAATTNYREPGVAPGTRTRGALPLRLLRAASVTAGIASLAEDHREYGGFHVIAGDADGLWHLSSRGEGPTRLGPGVYAVSNGPRAAPWPKMARGVDALAAAIDSPDPTVDALFAVLTDRVPAPDALLPETGVGILLERGLSSRFIDLDGYGTRASTVLRVGEAVEIWERTWDEGGGLVEARAPVTRSWV